MDDLLEVGINMYIERGLVGLDSPAVLYRYSRGHLRISVHRGSFQNVVLLPNTPIVPERG